MLDNVQKSLELSQIDDFSSGASSLNSIIKYDKNNGVLILSGGRYDFRGKMRNLVIQNLMKDSTVVTQESKPCIVFLDGEYWGLYNMMEPYNAETIGKRFDINSSNIAIINSKVNYDLEKEEFVMNGEVIAGGKSVQEEYLQVFYRILSIDMAKENAYANIDELIDIDSFINYYSTMIYTSNSEWSEEARYIWKSKNISENTFEDGRWRWILNRTDKSLGMDEVSGYRINTFLMPVLKNDVLFMRLMENEKFRLVFTTTFF